MNIYFISNNKCKIQEVDNILKVKNINIIPYGLKIDEIQCIDIKNIAIDKVIKAFEIIHRPVFVEHTALLVSELEDLPAGLTQIFWDKLQVNKFSQFFRQGNDNLAIAKTIVAFCDGKKIETFEGEIKGRVVEPRHITEFQWDCIFEPQGYDKTFSELGLKKNEISMRKIALEKFKEYLEKTYESN